MGKVRVRADFDWVNRDSSMALGWLNLVDIDLDYAEAIPRAVAKNTPEETRSSLLLRRM